MAGEALKRIRIYVKNPCPFCVRAKALLNQLNLPYEEVDLTGQDAEIQKIKHQSGWATVPIIYFEDELIGGFQELLSLYQSGRLWAKLQKHP